METIDRITLKGTTYLILASKDGSGNNIEETYATKNELISTINSNTNLLKSSDLYLLNNIRTYQIQQASSVYRTDDGWWRIITPNGTTDGELYIEDNFSVEPNKIYTKSIEIRSDNPITANIRFHRAGFDYNNIIDQIIDLGNNHYRLIASFLSDGYSIRPVNIWHINAPNSSYIEIRFPIITETDNYIPWQPNILDLTDMRQELNNTIFSSINNIDIGGVNLIPDSLNYLSELKVYPHDDSKYSYVISGNYRRINLLQGDLNNDLVVQEKYLSDIDKLRDLTYSVIVRTDGNITGGYFKIRGKVFNPTWVVDLDTTIQKVSEENHKWRMYATLKKDNPYTFSQPIVMQLMGVTTEGATYIEFGYPKVEYGNKPTDWSPAIGEQQGGSLDDAPSDGKTYGRNNGQWEDLSTTFATKEELGEIGSVLDTINGEVI